MTEQNNELLALTADIVSAHVANNTVALGDLPTLIGAVHSTLAGLGAAPEAAAEALEPAVSVRSSIKPDYIVCLEDGKKLKMLKRHLMTHYNLTPDQYRARWSLPSNYPMVAPNYAEQRRNLAKSIGLGRKPKLAAAPVAAEAPAPKARRRKAAPAPVAEAPAPAKTRRKKAAAPAA